MIAATPAQHSSLARLMVSRSIPVMQFRQEAFSAGTIPACKSLRKVIAAAPAQHSSLARLQHRFHALSHWRNMDRKLSPFEQSQHATVCKQHRHGHLCHESRLCSSLFSPLANSDQDCDRRLSGAALYHACKQHRQRGLHH